MKRGFLAGLDLGSVQVKLVLFSQGAEGDKPLLSLARPNHGKTRQVALALLAQAAAVLGPGAVVHLGVTGASAGLLAGGAGGLRPVNQMAAAVAGINAGSGAVRTILDLGGQFSSWILVGGNPDNGNGTGTVEDFALNGLCAAGSGVFLEQQAARLQLSVAELGRLAEKAGRGAAIAGRCSVFAKSDMVHLQQKGTPLPEIAYGLCLALARTFVGTVLENRPVETPVAVIGGGAANPGLLRALHQVLDLSAEQMIVPENYLFACAGGAALAAAAFPPVELDRWLEDQAFPLPSVPRSRHPSGSLRKLVPAPSGTGIQPRPAPFIDLLTGRREKVPVHLGIDVGSVSTNVVLLSPQMAYLDGVYIATGGKPVDALDRALREITGDFADRLEVLSTGATGSGRYLAQRLIGADTVKNEISAQLASATHFFPEVESVFEIGGQDAKFMNVGDGLLQDFEMNKICSAGTGSFLEEQAERLGVNIIDQFSDLAFKGLNPVDLGSRCTVFMDRELCQAVAAGHRLEDLCAGLAYAVARNYLEKVVAGARIGARVVFQGGTAANRAVVSAFAALLGRPIFVHPRGRVSGAIGAALLAAKEWQASSRPPSLFLGFTACRGHRLESFACEECSNRCQVNRVHVGEQRVHFGDVCERYSARDKAAGGSRKGDKPAALPNLFAARADLLTCSLPSPKKGTGPRIGLIRGGLMAEYLPFWSHLLQELGFAPIIAGDMADRGERPDISPALCLPQKLAAAEVDQLFRQQKVERVLLPSILELAPVQARDRTHTCIYSQQLSDMLRQKYGEHLLTPQLGIVAAGNLLREAILVIAELFGVSTRKVGIAWKIAMHHQGAFVAARHERGRQALASLGGRGVVVIGKPYNLHDGKANLGLARQLLRLGLPALPMDLLPLADEYLDDAWYMLPWQLNRQQIRALRQLDTLPDLYPIFVSNHGCGPDAFTTSHLLEIWGAKPRLFLEFDGHQGEAGLVTRLEAFADEIAAYGKAFSRARPYGKVRTRPDNTLRRGCRYLLPYTSEHVHAYAGMFRRMGIVSEILPPPDGQSARLGEEVTSGRECHPYTLIAGDLAKLVASGTVRDGDRFFLPGTRLPCLLSQYGDGLRHVVKELSEDRLEVFDQHSGEAAAMFGKLGMLHLYEGLTVIDYLLIASCRMGSCTGQRGAIDLWLATSVREVEETLAEKGDIRGCFARCLARLAKIKVQNVAPRPIIGVTGDLYTRVNRTGNAGLFAKLEEMGCEVWPSPFFAATTDFELPQNSLRWRKRGEYSKAVNDLVTATFLRFRARRLAELLPPDLRARCVEPPQALLQSYALPYVAANSNHLIRTMVAKMVDFARRGAGGVINAIGLNCMAGTAATAAIPHIRRDHGNLPIISLTSGGDQGLSQTIQLDTFVRQVRDRCRRQELFDNNSHVFGGI